MMGKDLTPAQYQKWLKSKGQSPIHGIDDVISGSMQAKKTKQETIIIALFYAYARCLRDRRKEGDRRQSFTRRDYMKYKKEEDPTYRVIERTFGTWSKAVATLPTPEDEPRLIIDLKEISMMKLSKIMKRVAKANKVDSVGEVTAQMYRNYASKHEGVPDWKTFARYYGYGEKWTLLKEAASEYTYRKDALKRDS